jgi:hypothetical protein
MVARGPAWAERTPCPDRAAAHCRGVPQARSLSARRSAAARLPSSRVVCRLSGPVSPHGEGSAWAEPRRVPVVGRTSHSRPSVSAGPARPAGSPGVAPASGRVPRSATASVCPAAFASNAVARRAAIRSARRAASSAPLVESLGSRRASVRTADVTPCPAPLDARRAWLVTACDKRGAGAGRLFRLERFRSGTTPVAADTTWHWSDPGSRPNSSRRGGAVLTSIWPDPVV